MEPSPEESHRVRCSAGELPLLLPLHAFAHRARDAYLHECVRASTELLPVPVRLPMLGQHSWKRKKDGEERK